VHFVVCSLEQCQLRHWPSQLPFGCTDDRAPDGAVSPGRCRLYDSEGPVAPWQALIRDEDDVSLAEVAALAVPLLACEQLWHVLLGPATPKHIREVLRLTPPSLCVLACVGRAQRCAGVPPEKEQISGGEGGWIARVRADWGDGPAVQDALHLAEHRHQPFIREQLLLDQRAEDGARRSDQPLPESSLVA